MISSEKDDKRKEKLQLLYNETLDKNVIIDVLNQEQKQIYKKKEIMSQ